MVWTPHDLDANPLVFAVDQLVTKYSSCYNSRQLAITMCSKAPLCLCQKTTGNQRIVPTRIIAQSIWQIYYTLNYSLRFTLHTWHKVFQRHWSDLFKKPRYVNIFKRKTMKNWSRRWKKGVIVITRHFSSAVLGYFPRSVKYTILR